MRCRKHPHDSSPATLFQLFLLHRYHVAAMDRRSFGALDSEGQHFIRLSIATGAETWPKRSSGLKPLQTMLPVSGLLSNQACN